MFKTLILAAALASTAAQAQDTDFHVQYVGNLDIYSGKYSVLNGQVNWHYNPANQPNGMSEAIFVKIAAQAASAWEHVCNVHFNYQGLSTNNPTAQGISNASTYQFTYGWSAFTSPYVGYGAYTSPYVGGPAQSPYIIGANIALNTDSWFDAATHLGSLEGELTHEMGHALGLAHSDKQASVMFANPYNSLLYMQTLRQDDIDGCVALYGPPTTPVAIIPPATDVGGSVTTTAPTTTTTTTPTTTPPTTTVPAYFPTTPTAIGDFVFNWAEKTYPTVFKPATYSITLNGYYYRYYKGTDNYLAINVATGQMYAVGAMTGWQQTDIGTGVSWANKAAGK